MLNARLLSSWSRKCVCFGISFAILASSSTSSTASTFVAVSNNLQSKITMAVVSLSRVAAIFDGDVMLMASAVKMPIIRIFKKKRKRARHVSAVVHARMRDKTYPVQGRFSDSLWARIRRSRSNVGPRIQYPEENESADSKTKFLFLFWIWSCQVQGVVQSLLYDHLVWCSHQVWAPVWHYHFPALSYRFTKLLCNLCPPYAYTRLPYGVSSAPSIWQRVIEQIVHGIEGVMV